MLPGEESRFQAPRGPVERMSCLPALGGRHLAESLNLKGASLVHAREATIRASEA
jgi:hypothetical protein